MQIDQLLLLNVSVVSIHMISLSHSAQSVLVVPESKNLKSIILTRLSLMPIGDMFIMEALKGATAECPRAELNISLIPYSAHFECNHTTQ